MNNDIYIDIINRKSIRSSGSILSVAQICEQLSLQVSPDKRKDLLVSLGKQISKLHKEIGDFEENLDLFIQKIAMDNEENEWDN